jgi:organic anion transporter 3A
MVSSHLPEIPGDLRPGSPEERASVKDGVLKPGRPLSPDDSDGKKEDLSSMECGLGPCNLPVYFHELANIKVFVGILSLLVTLQQAVASGYVSSVITTIEARFEIPSKYTGLVASAYEIGNVVTVLFVSYLGAKRHIPRWIAVGEFSASTL